MVRARYCHLFIGPFDSASSHRNFSLNCLACPWADKHKQAMIGAAIERTSLP
jgi:hypothetical protein